MIDSLHTISPLDGRYKNACLPLREYFSEFALIKKRVEVELKYLSALKDILPQKKIGKKIGEIKEGDFKEEDAIWIKEKEKETRHDVKAVEYFIREKIINSPFVHFGLTSQDINNTAIPMLIRDADRNVMFPVYIDIFECLIDMERDWKDIKMLSHTHGQPATPTTFGKEMAVFRERIGGQRDTSLRLSWRAKFGGVNGELSVHSAIYPDINWDSFAEDFVKSLGLVRTYPTTQIEPYDHLASYLQLWTRTWTILKDLCQDMWLYALKGYITIHNKEKEIGSSAMPHKVNPIDFENAEGNLGLAIAMATFMANKLPVSRLQRDLTDSTILRNIGVCMGYGLVAMKSIKRGLSKTTPNKEKIASELKGNWQVKSEIYQAHLRAKGDTKAYERVKDIIRRGGTEEEVKKLFKNPPKI